ncbi:MAG: class I SAM-dependent methyltransferase [Actinobacteria bacterium]|nr:class I SAM-dependent methyltransferase [Actinomycetota bacterium]
MGEGLFLDDAARRTLALYDDEPLAVRVHTKLRWRSCPFVAVAAEIPRRGPILEIGCGHGLFSAYLAVQSADRDVVGTDVDGAKIRVAARAATRSRRHLRFEAIAPGELPQGAWMGIAVVDVLYLMQPTDQEELLRRAARLLAPGGVLVVKEMALEPRWKFSIMRLQEVVAVHVARITAGATLTFVPPARTGAWLTSAGLMVESRPVHAGYPHPHHLLVARRPPPD